MAHKVMIIDDEMEMREILGELIRDEGIDVVLAEDGIDGLNNLALDGDIGLILCDLKMPRMGGSEFLECCKSNHSHIPVIILTGDANFSIQSSRFENIFSIITKPFDLARLVTAVRRALPV